MNTQASLGIDFVRSIATRLLIFLSTNMRVIMHLMDDIGLEFY